MGVKRFLYAVRDEQKEIAELQERIADLRASLLPSAIRYDKDAVQTSTSDVITDKMIKIAEYDTLLDKKIAGLYARRAKAQKLIDLLPDSLERQVLSIYFLSDGRPTMEQVASKLNYSVQHTFRIYASGFDHLRGRYKDESK